MNDILLPPSASELERHLEAVTARLGHVPTPLRPLWNPWTCPVETLPWLAWALSVDEWDATWPEAVRRRVIANSVAIHRCKGTPDAVLQALNYLEIEPELTEWWQYRGTPHTFRLSLAIQQLIAQGRYITPQLVEDLLRLVHSTKRASAHLDALEVGTRHRTTVAVAGVGNGIGFRHRALGSPSEQQWQHRPQAVGLAGLGKGTGFRHRAMESPTAHGLDLRPQPVTVAGTATPSSLRVREMAVSRQQDWGREQIQERIGAIGHAEHVAFLPIKRSETSVQTKKSVGASGINAIRPFALWPIKRSETATQTEGDLSAQGINAIRPFALWPMEIQTSHALVERTMTVLGGCFLKAMGVHAFAPRIEVRFSPQLQPFKTQAATQMTGLLFCNQGI